MESPIFFHTTADGSPTASIESAASETMHNTLGAFSETLYVYGRALELYWVRNLKVDLNSPMVCQVCSIGLGLGYVEILIVCFLMSLEKNTTTSSQSNIICCIESYESNELLRSSFVRWILSAEPNRTTSHQAVELMKRESSTIPNDLVPDSIYNSILKLYSNQFNLIPESIRLRLAQLYHTGELSFFGEFRSAPLFQADSENLQKRGFNTKQNPWCFCFDAFSPKTSPDLWSDSLLAATLSQLSEGSVFATYASRTSLKKQLKRFHFELQKTPGFGSKRESTLAIKVDPDSRY